jgi:translation initiation factor IF-3
MAREKGLDLVEVAPNAQPPVCRIMDFGKYAFEQAKRERDARKNQKTIEIKTLRLKPKTSDYHEGFKVKQARQWLADGAKVKVMILFKGRELYVSADMARQQLADVVNALSDVAVVEQRPDIEGKTMFMMLAPIGSKPPAKSQQGQSAKAAPVAQAQANRPPEQGKTDRA